MHHTFILSFSLMASSIHFASPILMAILFHLLLDTNRTCFASHPTRKTPTGLRLALTRVDFDKSLPNNQYPSKNWNGPRSSMKNPAKAFKDVYVTNLAIGTPPVMFSALVDTGSDLIWTKCKPKTASSSSPRLFDPSKSSSFSKVNERCESFQLDGCQQDYDDHTHIKVNLGRETLTMGDAKVRNVTFACGIPTGKPFVYDGIVGMGRGKLSLIWQLNERVFSYCFGSRFHKSERSILQIGPEARESMGNNMIQTTPFINQGSYYYISLEGISVGETRLPVTKSDFAIKNGDGGMVIDSGTTFTYLEKRIVNMIEEEFMNQTKFEKVKGSDTTYNTLASCFSSPYDVKIVPKLVFHFNGANWDLPRENYIYEKDHRACLAFIANDDDHKVSIFGNIQQQNMMVLYDLEKNSLSFAPANCNK